MALNIRSIFYPVLWGAFFACFYWLHKHSVYSIAQDWKGRTLTKTVIKEILKRFSVLAIPLLAFTWWYAPEKLFAFPLNNFSTWLLVMFAYPVLSVVPQELIFRSFFLRRYATIFPSEKYLWLASALCFGWAHVVIQTWISVVFSAIGGWIFTTTYARTRSLAAACFEHALYGCYIFTIGLGWYFYHANGMR